MRSESPEIVWSCCGGIIAHDARFADEESLASQIWRSLPCSSSSDTV